MCKNVCRLIVICCCLFVTKVYANNNDECNGATPVANFCEPKDLEKGKVDVCHVPPGCTAKKFNICVHVDATDNRNGPQNHRPGAHGGDYLGPCNTDSSSSSSSSSEESSSSSSASSESSSSSSSGNKVLICHITSAEDRETGEPKAVSIEVDESAVPTHLENHCNDNVCDRLGACWFDCANELFGPLSYDECNVCGGDNSDCSDCNQHPNGTAVVDLCGVCREENDESVNTTCLDCSGVPNGEAQLDQCGVCDGDGSTCSSSSSSESSSSSSSSSESSSSSSVSSSSSSSSSASPPRDCKGVINGRAKLDRCGVCAGNGRSCCPLVAIDYNVTGLLEQFLLIANDKTIKYYEKGYKCGHRKLDRAVTSSLKKVAKAQVKVVKAQSKLVTALATGNVKKIVSAQQKLAKEQSKLLVAERELYDNNYRNNFSGKIVQVRSLIVEFKRVLNSLKTTIRLCPGECSNDFNKKKLERLAYLNEVLYKTYAHDAQVQSNGLCNSKGGHQGTKPLKDKLGGDIKQCHNKNSCR